MRVWGSLDIGNQDSSNSIRGKADGVYFQYWGGSAPAYNDGADGLQHLDYADPEGRKLGLKLVIPTWSITGTTSAGWISMCAGAAANTMINSYTDPVIRQWYKNWIAHLLNRTNIYTGVKYPVRPDDHDVGTGQPAALPERRSI